MTKTSAPPPAPSTSMPPARASVTKALTMGHSALYHLILSQAGSLSKALTELISNSFDAGASAVHVVLTDTGYTVTDDGHGFRSEEEVDLYFAPLAFDHTTPEEAGKRQFGRFGIGRGQQWAFARTVYRSRSLSMDVDPKTRGFEFVMNHHAEEFPGTQITGTLYERLTLNAKATTEQELTEAVNYSAVPVYLNGKLISRTPTGEKWDFEDDAAWYRFNDSYTMKIYNMGIFVRTYSSYHMGVGGTVVSKPGRSFDLNMARNDVLTSKCSLWKHVETVTRRQAKKNTTRSRLSENDYHTLISELLEHPEQTDPARLETLKLFVDHKGRNMTIWEFLSRTGHYGRQVIAFDENHKRALERVHTNKQALVMHPRTFTRIGTPTDGRTRMQHLKHVTEQFLNRLSTPTNGYAISHIRKQQYAFLEHLPDDLTSQADRYETFPVAPPTVTHTLKALNQGALEHMIANIRGFLNDEGQRPARINRTARCGASDAANFWMNLDTLVIEQGILEEGQRNAEGWNRMLMQIAAALLNLMLDRSQETANDNNELEYRLMYSAQYTLLKWNLMSLTVLTGMAGRNELVLNASMRKDLSDVFALDTAQQKLPQDPDRPVFQDGRP